MNKPALLAIIYITTLTSIISHQTFAANVVQDAWNAVKIAKEAIAPAVAARNAAQAEVNAANKKLADANKALADATTSAETTAATAAKEAAWLERTAARAKRDAAAQKLTLTLQHEKKLNAAASLATGDVVGIGMCQVTSILSGGISKAIATLAIFSLAIGLFMGKVNWGIALITSAGIAIIFNIPTILGFITGGSGASNPCIIAG